MRISIRWKWMFAHLITGFFVLLYVVFYLNSRLQNHFEAQFENRWQRELDLAHSFILSENFSTMTYGEADQWADKIGKILAMRVTLIDSAGEVVGDSRIETAEIDTIENHSDRPEVIQALKQGFGRARRFSTTIQQNLLYLALPITTEGSTMGVIRIAVPTAEIDESIAQIHNLVWLASGAGFIFVVLAGFVVSARMTSRMHQMAETAKNFAVGDFSKEFSTRTKDELSDLGEALNQMGKDLQENVTQITNERDQLQAILNSMVEGVMVCDLSGNILLTNNSFEKIFNLHRPIIKNNIRDVFTDEQLLNALEKALDRKEDTVVALDIFLQYKKNLEAHIAVLGTPEHPSGIVAVFHDTTKLQHLEKVRRDFVANVSHELRTPLTAIKGYMETLLDDKTLDAEKSRSFLQTVLRHSDRMAKLVEDLLTLSKLESLETDTELESINVEQIIYQVSDNFSKIKEKYDLELVFDIQDGLPPIKGLFREIHTALENLIDNAIKYGQEGSLITISAKELPNAIKISVSDEGIGIPEQDQPRIFERFYRVDKGRSRQLGGTGLGLSIVKHIVQRHNGQIWVDSKPGEGATFNFTIPKAQNQQPAFKKTSTT